MEEDIEILEEFIKYYEAEATSRKFRGTLSISVDQDDIEAIENLIKGYRKIEEILKHKNDLIKQTDKDLETDYIPKSKIKEKIEELKEIPNKMVIDKGIPEEYKNIFLDKRAINVLQELLEE